MGTTIVTVVPGAKAVATPFTVPEPSGSPSAPSVSSTVRLPNTPAAGRIGSKLSPFVTSMRTDHRARDWIAVAVDDLHAEPPAESETHLGDRVLPVDEQVGDPRRITGRDDAELMRARPEPVEGDLSVGSGGRQLHTHRIVLDV